VAKQGETDLLGQQLKDLTQTNIISRSFLCWRGRKTLLTHTLFRSSLAVGPRLF